MEKGYRLHGAGGKPLSGRRNACEQNPLSPAKPACFTPRVKVDLGIWSKLTQAVIALVVIAVLILIGMTYVPLIHQNERMRREIERLDAELQKQDDISKQLRADIESLRSDPATVSRLVREKLGYAKPDETVIRFETNSPAPAAPR
jgi:cell division protein FtsB